MKATVAAVFLFSMVIFLPAPVAAKSPTIKITIEGASLRTPIEITDPKSLSLFNVWAGPGTSSNEAQSLIIDWSGGVVGAPPKGSQRYRVSFYPSLTSEQPMYVVFYEYDPRNERGHVYLPGRGEEWYQLNVASISRRVEGNWFRAWDRWDKLARPLIAMARTSSSPHSKHRGAVQEN